MLVTLLFPLLLFAVVLVLFGIEHRFVPPDQEAPRPQPESLAAHQEELEGPLPHYIDLWERIDSAIEGERRERSLRPVHQSPEPRRLVARPSLPSEVGPRAGLQDDRPARARTRRGNRRTALRRPAA